MAITLALLKTEAKIEEHDVYVDVQDYGDEAVFEAVKDIITGE